MKICPKCNKIYADERLNFCLDDGTVLTQAGGDSLPETVMMSNPPPTQPNSPFQQTNPNTPFISETPTQQRWGNQPAPQMQTPKKSRSWLWVLGILGGVILLCGGGLVGLVALSSFGETDDTNNDIIASNKKDNNSTASDPQPDINTDSGDTIDLSKWNVKSSAYGNVDFKNGEFVMSSKKRGFYYVLVAKNYVTEDATTKLTVRNVDEKDTRLGFGLVFHSADTPLVRDYAFLIDSEKKRYRIVSHSPGKEKSIVGWKNSSVIKNGSQKNVLEVRDKDGKMSFYINGQFVTSEKNEDDSKDGIPGLYSGDAVPIAFSDFIVTEN